VRLFHSTSAALAAAIRAGGFRDGRSGSFNRNGDLCCGVWFSEREMTGDFELGGVVFEIDLPDDVANEHEWPDPPGQSSAWRVFRIPALIVNAYPFIERGGTTARVLHQNTAGIA
jgi:hypothetical protein